VKVPRSELVPVLAKLSQKLPPKKFTAEMANYLLSENRIGELDSLARDLINYRAENGVVEVTAVSARPLAPSVLNDAKRKVKQLYPAARQIIVNQRIDDDQIGGVRLEMPGKQLDLSVRNKLNQFKQLTAGK
jgi:F0F1-type ATP synthase delta subunit